MAKLVRLWKLMRWLEAGAGGAADRCLCLTVKQDGRVEAQVWPDVRSACNTIRADDLSEALRRAVESQA